MRLAPLPSVAGLRNPWAMQQYSAPPGSFGAAGVYPAMSYPQHLSGAGSGGVGGGFLQPSPAGAFASSLFSGGAFASLSGPGGGADGPLPGVPPPPSHPSALHFYQSMPMQYLQQLHGAPHSLPTPAPAQYPGPPPPSAIHLLHASSPAGGFHVAAAGSSVHYHQQQQSTPQPVHGQQPHAFYTSPVVKVEFPAPPPHGVGQAMAAVSSPPPLWVRANGASSSRSASDSSASSPPTTRPASDGHTRGARQSSPARALPVKDARAHRGAAVTGKRQRVAPTPSAASSESDLEAADDTDDNDDSDDNASQPQPPRDRVHRSLKAEHRARGAVEGGGPFEGLGPYELELLQREVDELHDEAMAERMRAEDSEGRYQHLLTQLKALHAKLDLVPLALAGSDDTQAPERPPLLAMREVQRSLTELLTKAAQDTREAVNASNITTASSVAHARLSRFMSKHAQQGESVHSPCGAAILFSLRVLTTASGLCACARVLVRLYAGASASRAGW